MSWRIVAQVRYRAQDFSATELLIMLTIAEHCHDCGHGWLAYSRLAAQTRLSERHVKRVVRSLVIKGHLNKIDNKIKNRSNMYTIVHHAHSCHCINGSDMVSLDPVREREKKS